MYKLLFSTFKYIIILSLLLFFCKVIQYEKAQLFRRYSQSPIIREYSNHSSSHQTQILEHLEYLTAFPVLGDLYLQQKVLQLQNLKRYEEALASVNQAISSVMHPQSFKLWYIKARNELTLKMYNQAEKSLIKASFFVKKNTEDLILGKLYDNLPKNKIQKKKNDDFDNYSFEETFIQYQTQL